MVSSESVASSRECPFSVVDGGGASELERRGYELSGALWAAAAYFDAPEKVAEVHRAYLDAGADIITTLTYQASIPGLVALGLDEAQMSAFFRRAVALAERERDRYFDRAGRLARVALSFGPYGAYLADGSEYRGDYRVSQATLEAFHGQRLDLAGGTGADLFVFETVPSLTEVAAITGVCCEQSPAGGWISFSVGPGETLADGGSLVEAIALVETLPPSIGIGVNCLAPSRVTDLTRFLRERTNDRAVVVYPNAGECYSAATREWAGEREPLGDDAVAWYEAGARIIGGCCRTTPADVASVRAALTARTSGGRGSAAPIA